MWTNLIVNAVDAMGGKGELRIRTSQVDNDVLVEIVDKGPGIPDNVREHQDLLDVLLVRRRLIDKNGP